MRKLRLSTFSSLVIIWLLLFNQGWISSVSAVNAADEQFFPQTGQMLSGKFLDYWKAHGGLATFGYPLTSPRPEKSPTDSKVYLTQWFERNRFELHPEKAGTKYEVLLGLLGNELRQDAWQVDPDFVRTPLVFDSTIPASQQSYFEQTGHNLRLRFLEYWQQNGSLERFGFPISEEYPELDPITGKVYVVQWFERARFEHHPENRPPYDVLLGLLGRQIVQPSNYPTLVWKMGGQPFSLGRTTGMVVDSRGAVYVAGASPFPMLKFDLNGRLILGWGETGADPGQLKNPVALALDKAGNVYVSDAGNARITKFDPVGHFLVQFGEAGKGDGQFGAKFDNVMELWVGGPQGLAVNSQGEILVVDPLNNRVEKFDQNGRYLSQFGSYGRSDGQFRSPYAVAVDREDNIYVTDQDNGRVQKFDSNAKFLLKFGSRGSEEGQFNGPANLTIDSRGNIFVSDWSTRVQKFAPTGHFLKQWGRPANLAKPKVEDLSSVRDVAIDRQDNLYVLATGNNGVYKFSNDGQFLLKWDDKLKNNPFNSPDLAAIDSKGNLYVADIEDNLILKFDRLGQLLLKWNITLDKDISPESSLRIAALTIDKADNLYVGLNWGKIYIQKYDPEGGLLAILAVGDYSSSSKDLKDTLSQGGLAVDNQNNLFLANNIRGEIWKVDLDGKLLVQLRDPSSKNNLFDALGPIVLDDQENLIVATPGAIRKLDQTGRLLISYPGLPQPTEYSTPMATALALDQTGNLYVAIDWKRLIYQYDRQGVLTRDWGSLGQAAGQLGSNGSYYPRSPGGLAVDDNKYLYIVDTSNQRLQKYLQPFLKL